MDYLVVIIAVCCYLFGACLICSPFIVVSYKIYEKKTINTGLTAALLLTFIPVLSLGYTLFDCVSSYL